MELRALLPDALQDDTEIVTVSVDDREGMKRMIDRVSASDGVAPDFIMLSDPDHSVIDRYGLFNEDAPPNRPLPIPATYVIDKEGSCGTGSLRWTTGCAPPTKTFWPPWRL